MECSQFRFVVANRHARSLVIVFWLLLGLERVFRKIKFFYNALPILSFLKNKVPQKKKKKKKFLWFEKYSSPEKFQSF